MKEGLRILMLGDGRSFHVERLLAELRRTGHEVRLASLEHSEIVDYPLNRRGPLRRLHYTLAASQLSELIKEFDPEIVYAHYATGYGYLAALAAESLHKKIVLNLWGSDIFIVPHKSKMHLNKARRALRAASFVIADSDFLMEEAKKLASVGAGAVIPWGVEREYLDFYSDGKRIGEPLKIIVPRAHEDVYDNLFIVRALADLIRDKKIEVTFPAFGSRWEHFEAEAKRLSGGETKYYERLSRREFMRFYSGFDVYLSNAQSDSSPVSMIEAMGLGLLVVARDIPGIREWLSSESGFLYPAEDTGALHRLIEEIALKKVNPEKMRAANRERVLTNAIFEENVATQIEIMRGLRNGEPA